MVLSLAICAGVNCNNGSCLTGDTDYTCQCLEGFTGSHCDEGIILKHNACTDSVWTFVSVLQLYIIVYSRTYSHGEFSSILFRYR